MAGIAPFAGFFSKDEILGGAWSIVGHAAPPGWPSWYGYVLWGGLLIAALGTAFYMWRLYFLVFSGEERSEEAKHAHESPLSMTLPLVVLAFLATIAGLIGLPHLESVHLPSWWPSLAHWLEQSTVSTWYNPAADGTMSVQAIHGHVGDTTTLLLMGLAFGIGALGIVLAWSMYGAGGKGPSKTVEQLVDGPLQQVYQASKAKLWFDEIYDATIVKPFRLIASGLYRIVDSFIIDTVAVNGAAMVIGLFGRISRWFQNGQVQRYLAGVVIGAACVFFVTDCHAKPTFTYEIVGDRLHLVAKPGAGIIGATTKLRWDIDGDGQPDTDPNTGAVYETPELYVLYGDTRTQVTLFIDDPITRTTKTITRVIEAPPAPAPAEPTAMKEGK
jgi:NADH-quinone oxidoreductase subunit L